MRTLSSGLAALLSFLVSTVFAVTPDPPTSALAIPGNAKASVSFFPPAFDGGNAITSYTVTSSPGGLSASGTSLPIVVTGLVNGTTYTFTVRATNSSGSGSASTPSNPVTPILPTIAPMVSAASISVAALDASGQVYMWGSDYSGQLGQGRPMAQSTPVRVSGLPPIKHLSIYQHALAVDVYGQVWSWGDNNCGETGQRESPNTAKPSRIIGATGFSKVAAGYCRSFGLKPDGTVWNLHGGIAAMSFPSGIVDITQANLGYLLALRNDGTVYVAAVAAPPEDPRTTPRVITGLANVAAIATGVLQSIALQANGDIRVLDVANAVVFSAAVGGLSGPAIAVSVSSSQGLAAARADGTVWRSGFSTSPFAASWTPVVGMSGALGLEYCSPRDTIFGIGSGGTLTGNGVNYFGQLAQGTYGDIVGTVGIPGFESGTVQVQCGPFTGAVLALKSDGSVWFWGSNETGQRGDGILVGSSVPLAVKLPATIKSVAAAAYFTLALDTNGQVWGWGAHEAWQVTASDVPRSAPAPIAGLTNVTRIAANGLAAYVKTDGTAWVSGVSSIPGGPGVRQVAGLSSIADVAAGYESILFLRSDGVLFSIGVNRYGQLGDGTTTDRSTPVPVTGITGAIRKVAAGGNGAAAVTTDGRVYFWGSGATSEGTFPALSTPVEYPGIADAIDIAWVGAEGIIRRSGGTAYNIGRQGTGVSTPTLISFYQPVQAMAIGANRYLVAEGGVLWGSGTSSTLNYQGTVGDGTYVSRPNPVVIHAHAGGGSLDGGNWFLDLQPDTPEIIPQAAIPKVLSTSALYGKDAIALDSTVKYKSADYGKGVNNYVLALVPPTFLGLVPNAPGTSSAKALAARAKTTGGQVLVQLTPAGWTDVNGQIIAYSSGVASAFGGASSILNGVGATAISGSRFCIGYGESADSMLTSQAMREVLVVDGSATVVSGVPCVISGVYLGGPSTSVQSSPVTFTASVVGLSPTGSVQFQDGTSPLGTTTPIVAVNEAIGRAAHSTSSLALGMHSIGAAYSGDPQNSPTASEAPKLHEVRAPLAQTRVDLAGPASSERLTEVTFVATITGNQPTGAVRFLDGGLPIGNSVPVIEGIATQRTFALGLGNHAISADYSGDGNNSTGMSGLLAHTVLDFIEAQVRMTSLANPVSRMKPIEIEVTVTGRSPSGGVTLREGAAILDSKSLQNGVATVSVTGLAPGVHQLSADYSGDFQNPPASSPILFQEVVLPGSPVMLTVTPRGTGSGTVTSVPAGIVCGASCASTFPTESTVTLETAPALGSRFIGWEGGGCSGTAPCVINIGSAMSVKATFQLWSPTPRLGNISTRLRVLTGNDVMIAGFIIGGSTAKTVVINVAGPSLASFGITNPLANPTLTLVRSSDNAIIAANDNWQSAVNASQIEASGFAPNNPLEPAIMMTLAPGAYTAIVQGVSGTGVGLVGVFEVDQLEVPLTNISTRGQVSTGNDVMIGGFIIQGDSTKTVVINVAGPSLVNFGILNPLADPTLTLVRSSDNAIIATNDNWQSAANAAQIQASGFAPNHPLEPAIMMTLAPGAYTVIVQGVGGTAGTGLVGVFTAP